MTETEFPTDILKSVETPVYYYDMGLLRDTLDALVSAVSSHAGYNVHYAMKANANPAILEAVRKAGLGIDAVSGGEISRALECGFAPDKIVFAGVGKTDRSRFLVLP